MRSIKFRVIIQRDNINKDKYYPDFISAQTSESFPWSASSGEIEIVTNTSCGTSGYISPIRSGDILRLQVDVRYSTTEKSVWENIYEGRIMDISSDFGTEGNNTTLICRGHSEEALYSLVSADYTASAKKTGQILEDLRALYLDRLSAGQIDTSNSSVLTSFNVEAKTKYIADVIRQLEQLEGFGYRFHTVRTYDSDNNLSTIYASWQPITTTVSKTVQVIEGTTRLLSARFSSTLSRLVNDVTIKGLDSTPQKVGTASDATSKTKYDARYHVETDLTLATDALCTALAVAIKDKFKDPLTIGTATITGDSRVEPGDLVYCKIPSLEIDGASIDGNYRVRRVSHNIDSGGWTTTLDLGELEITPADVIADFHTKNRLNNANFIS